MWTVNSPNCGRSNSPPCLDVSLANEDRVAEVEKNGGWGGRRRLCRDKACWKKGMCLHDGYDTGEDECVLRGTETVQGVTTVVVV
eukprot:3863878-Amphidinium_carterae.3